jgi:hypothetical protein
VDGTSAALCDAAPEFRTRLSEDVAQYPEKRHLGRDVNVSPFAIDCQCDHENASARTAFLNQNRSMQAEQLGNGIADASMSAVFSER